MSELRVKTIKKNFKEYVPLEDYEALEKELGQYKRSDKVLKGGIEWRDDQLQKLNWRGSSILKDEEDLWIGLDGTIDHPCWRLYLNGDDLGCYPDEELLSEVKMITRELLKKRK